MRDFGAGRGWPSCFLEALSIVGCGLELKTTINRNNNPGLPRLIFVTGKAGTPRMPFDVH
jgi:hypothetical protein